MLRASRAVWASNPALPNEDRLVTALNQLLAVLGGLVSSPFIGLLLSRIVAYLHSQAC